MTPGEMAMVDFICDPRRMCGEQWQIGTVRGNAVCLFVVEGRNWHFLVVPDAQDRPQAARTLVEAIGPLGPRGAVVWTIHEAKAVAQPEMVALELRNEMVDFAAKAKVRLKADKDAEKERKRVERERQKQERARLKAEEKRLREAQERAFQRQSRAT